MWRKYYTEIIKNWRSKAKIQQKKKQIHIRKLEKEAKSNIWDIRVTITKNIKVIRANRGK